jgi:type VI secretion system secreted protein VgrG
MFVPRIGQEVIVDFLEGESRQPDHHRRVYNGDNKVPWDLPGNATQSGVLTRSSKGAAAANANAIRFEDKKGSEQLWIHAEKNQDIEVENDETHWVGHDRTKTIDHDENVHVKHDRTETVDNDETIPVDSNQTRRGGNRTVTVGSNQTIGHGGRLETVGAARPSRGRGPADQRGRPDDLSVAQAMTTTRAAQPTDVARHSAETVAKDSNVESART